MPTMQERIAERYPSLISLLKEPEIGKLLTQAVTNNWSPGVFQSKFMASRWFKSQSESQRRWWVTAHTDPGEAKRQRTSYSSELGVVAGKLGISLTAAELKWITEANLARGIEPDSQEMLTQLYGFLQRNPKRARTGAIGAAQKQINDMVHGQWMMSLSPQSIAKFGAEVAMGRRSIEDINAYMAKQAVKRFPHMAEMLAAGMTVHDIAEPVINAYAREMDWDAPGLAAKMSFDPNFAGLLGIRDPKTNKVRMPTEYEARTMARKRDDWWGTTSGRQSDAGMSQSLLQALGKRK